jgi:hypothetical protein
MIGMTTKARFRFFPALRFLAFPRFPDLSPAASDLFALPMLLSTTGFLSAAVVLDGIILAVSGIIGSLDGVIPGLLESEESGFGLNLFSLTVIPPVHCWLPVIILAGEP